MRVECFEFKRCCCCIPLRHGLLALAYFKLVVSLVVLGPFFVNIGLLPPATDRVKHLVRLAILAVCILVALGDLALTIVFVVGGHKKCPKLMRVYNYYSIAVLIMCASAYVLFHGFEMYYFIDNVGLIHSFIFLRTSLVTGLLNIGFQVYIILMNKSLIAKLENIRGFAFSNIAHEAECKMVDEEGNIYHNDIKISELENGVGLENDTEASEPKFRSQ